MYPFASFCEKSLKKTSLFKKDKNVLKHKTDMISESLTHLPNHKIETAIDLFELLLQIGEREKDELPLAYSIWKFITTVFEETEDLK